MGDGWDVRGKTVLITGAAGGIGSELARQLAAKGANLALLDVRADEIAELAVELGERVAWWEADVTALAELEAAAGGTVERFGGIDAVVANAGDIEIGSVERIDPADFDRVVEVDLLGVWRTVRATLPHVIDRRGYVLHVSSLSGDLQGPLNAPYHASKAGVQAFANTLRLEVEGLGVAVGVAHLMYVNTERGRGAVEHPAMKRLGGPRQMKPVRVARAARLLVGGIEGRARRIFVPRSARLALVAPDFLRKRLEDLARRRRWAVTMRELGV